jgi:hypothetical protein
MEKQALKELLYGGILELTKNRDFYHHSSVSVKYSNWTEQGLEALSAYINFIANKMIESEEESLNKRAKELVVKGLKGETV